MVVETDFTQALRELDARERELNEAGEALIEAENDVTMILAQSEDGAAVYCRAEVGALDGLDADAAIRALIEGNYFWSATAGGTLSIKDGAVFLTDRREPTYFAEDGALGEYLDRFVDTVITWRERLDSCRLPANEEGKAVTE